MAQGTIKDYDEQERTGSLLMEDHTEVAIDAVSVEGSELRSLRLGQRVRFDLVEEAGGKLSRASTEGFGASSIDFMIEYDVEGDDMPHAQIVRDKIMFAIVVRFAEEGITIPYPTQTAFTAAPK